MAELIYTQKPGSIPGFLKHIQTAGDPGTVTVKYLETAGFKSKNDRDLVRVLRALGFLDASNGTTDLWRSYRASGTPKVLLAQAIRQAYQGLFYLYPDANRKDDEAIRNWMKGEEPKASENVIQRALGTFRAICGEADFESAAQVVTTATPDPADTAMTGQQGGAVIATTTTALSSGPSVNINIQLELPATDKAGVYDALFESMKKHLFPDA